MRVKQTIEQNNWDDWRYSLDIVVDGESVFSVGDGEPEDNSLSRNFNDCYNIVALMRRAFEAGKRGEEFIFEEKGGDAS